MIQIISRRRTSETYYRFDRVGRHSGIDRVRARAYTSAYLGATNRGARGTNNRSRCNECSCTDNGRSSNDRSDRGGNPGAHGKGRHSQEHEWIQRHSKPLGTGLHAWE